MMKPYPQKPTPPWLYWVIYLLLGIDVIVFPLVLWSLNLPMIAHSYGEYYIPFELFGFTATLGLILVGILEYFRRPLRPLENFIPLLIFLLIGFHFLSQITEFSIKSGDYQCYENGAKILMNGENPYIGTFYIYPPLLAETMVYLHGSIVQIAGLLRIRNPSLFYWDILFYFYQCFQFVLVLLLFGLSYFFLRKFHIKPWISSVLVGILLVVNNPLIRTLRHNQVNLWILDFILFTLLFYQSYPLLGGLAISLAAHLKIYPLLLSIPFLWIRQFRLVIGFLLGMIGLFFLETQFFTDFTVWNQFIDFLKSFEGIYFLRVSSVDAVIHNLFRIINKITGSPINRYDIFADILVWIILGMILVWFGFRYWKREKTYLSQHPAGNDNLPRESIRIYGHLIDLIILSLLLSPVVWEHHFILALPVVLWAIVTVGIYKLWSIGLATFLIFAIPTFDVYPFSLHRLAGLLILTYYISPGMIKKYIDLDIPTTLLNGDSHK